MLIISVMSVVSQMSSIMCQSRVMSVTCQVSMLWSHGRVTCWSHVYYVDLMSVACWPHASPVNCISLLSHQLCDSRVNQASVMCYISQSHDHISHILVMCQSWIACHLSQTCWSHVNRVNHVSVMCWSHVSHVLVMGQSRVTCAAHLLTCHLWLNHISVMCWMHFNRINWQSCQTWSHVSLVRSITCQSCQSRVTHVGHVSHWLSIGHISLMCWSHATGVNRVTSPNCWSCFSHVSITCQLCLWHVNHAIASRWSRLCQSRDGVIMCRSCVSHVGHVPITYGHVPVVSHESIMCQWSTGLASDTCQTRSCVDCQSCESPVTCWSCQCVSHVSYLIMWWSLVDSWSLKCHVGHVWIMCQLCHSCVTMHRASHVNHVSYQ